MSMVPQRQDVALYAGIELGGTKCVLAVGDGSDRAWDGTVLPTTDPVSTTKAAAEWFREAAGRSGSLLSLGVACFGPLDPGTGAVAEATPKIAWRGWPVRAAFEEALGLPVQLDTDVNGAAIAERAWGAAQGCSDMLYVTIGTGVGVGAIANGAVVRGRSHPEMGHMRIPQHQADRDPAAPDELWGGNCVCHGNCWEGLAAGPARAKRAELWARTGVLGPDEAELESEYIAAGLSILIASFRPERVVLGGGVLRDRTLLPRVKLRIPELLDVGYFPEASDMDDLVVAPGLGDAAGVVGAVLLAAQLRPGHLRERSLERLEAQIQAGLARL
jgi:fructokinase